MMPERAFWEELDRLLAAGDPEAATELVQEQLEGFNEVLKAKFEEHAPFTIH